MTLGFTDKSGDFRPTEKYLPVLHSSMLFPNEKQKMNDEKKSHLYDFMRKAGKGYGITAGVTKMGVNKIQESRDESSRKKQEKINGINEAVSVIVEEPEISSTEKISQLQRLLNTSHKDMDNALLSRIRMELNLLHKANEKIKIKREPKQKQGNDVTFADRIDSDEPIEKIQGDYESDNKLDKEDERPLSTQDLAMISSIASQVS